MNTSKIALVALLSLVSYQPKTKAIVPSPSVLLRLIPSIKQLAAAGYVAWCGNEILNKTASEKTKPLSNNSRKEALELEKDAECNQ